MENHQCRIFKVDELELVSLLREEGRGALEGEVDVNWDPEKYLILAAVPYSAKYRILLIVARSGSR